MRLNFPNNSRSFDANRSRVCFWGYDSTIEISFFVAAVSNVPYMGMMLSP